MAILSKIDSNVTGLSYAKETSIGVLPDVPIWIQMEPNSYSNFGGQIATVAREPINASRQRQKGTVTDLTVGGSVNVDWTYPNLQDLLQGYFFANARRKLETTASAVASDVITVGSSGIAQVGDLILTQGFSVPANNGLLSVTVVAPTALTVSNSLTNGTPAAGNTVVGVGHQFGTTEVSIDVSQDLPRMIGTAVAATGTFTIAAEPTDGDTVTIGSTTYTFKTALTGTANQILIGGSAAASMTNMIDAITGAGTPGTQYTAATVVNTQVTATQGSGHVTVTALQAGTVGNAIATTATMTSGSNVWAAADLGSGTGAGFTTLGLIPGEWIFIGGDTSTTQFAQAANSGFVRINAITDDQHMTFDKTQATFVADAGTGKTVRVFFGRVIKNESNPALIIRQTYQLERTLGAPDTTEPSEIQAEYLIGCVPNTCKMMFGTGTKVVVDMDFVGTNNLQNSNTDGPAAGSRPALVSGNAFNTSSDFARLKMAILDPTTSNPSPLFAFLTTMDLTIDNKATPDKAVSVLGAFEVTTGFFTVDLSCTAYFSEVAAVQAVRNNADVTVDMALVQTNTVSLNSQAQILNQGFIVDVPLVALGDGRLNVAINKPIDLPLTIPAARDRVFDHTLLVVFFDFLPNLAVPAV